MFRVDRGHQAKADSSCCHVMNGKIIIIPLIECGRSDTQCATRNTFVEKSFTCCQFISVESDNRSNSMNFTVIKDRRDDEMGTLFSLKLLQVVRRANEDFFFLIGCSYFFQRNGNNEIGKGDLNSRWIWRKWFLYISGVFRKQLF